MKQFLQYFVNQELKPDPSIEMISSCTTLKLLDAEKLFYVSLCLEADARDWFYNNPDLSYICFNRLRHYEQSINQDVRQYYFDVMKLCKEANPLMDDASKLQYLKDGLKPSLRFDVLLKIPQTTTEFLEYAQKIEELKAINEQQDTESFPFGQPNYNNSYYNTTYDNNNSSERHVAAITTEQQYCNSIPKQPYQCYNCGANDHYIRNCPHFQ
ncbi:unnamed protein product [Rotaria sp. Silwood1]|nr:unnamed protein product [Rotaria sp. Silwood1]